MKEAALPESRASRELRSLQACVATVLELPVSAVPEPAPGEEPGTGWTISRWLGGLGLGIAPIASADSFAWPGPWIAQLGDRPGDRRFAVMYGVPSGIVWDPAGGPGDDADSITGGLLIAAADIALALPPRPPSPTAPGTVEAIFVAGSAGAPARALTNARALPGLGLDGDRHAVGAGTFPSGLPGSALTLIEAEVLGSFEPQLGPDEHRRNVVTRGIDLNALVGREFTLGGIRCRGMRLCEPCTVVQRYASRPVLRALVHRGGLRADILQDGNFSVGDEIRAQPPACAPGAAGSGAIADTPS